MVTGAASADRTFRGGQPIGTVGEQHGLFAGFNRHAHDAGRSFGSRSKHADQRQLHFLYIDA